MHEVEDVLLQVEFHSCECLGHLAVYGIHAFHFSLLQVSNDDVHVFSVVHLVDMLGFERLLTRSTEERVKTSKSTVSIPSFANSSRLAMFFSPTLLWSTAFMADMLTSGAVQTFEVALFSRMCCSRVCRVKRSLSSDSPLGRSGTRPGACFKLVAR